MEWMILIVVIPLVLVPLVLLCGFAGCVSFGSAPDPPSTTPPPAPPPGPPPAPTGLAATPVSTTEIDLSWIDNAGPGANYEISQEEGTKPWVDGYRKPGYVTSFADTGLIEGQTYTYRVRAVSAGIFSGFSNDAAARTLQWQTAFDAGPAGLNSDGPPLAGAAIIQRIDKSLLVNGRQIRLTLQASSSNPLVLDQVSISQAVPAAGEPGNPTPDPWDSASATLKLLGPQNIPAATMRILGPVDFQVSAAEDLIVAFDVNAANLKTRQQTAIAAATAYTNSGAAEAAVANRPTAGHTTRAATMFFVSKIEVLTG